MIIYQNDFVFLNICRLHVLGLFMARIVIYISVPSYIWNNLLWKFHITFNFMFLFFQMFMWISNLCVRMNHTLVIVKDHKQTKNWAVEMIVWIGMYSDIDWVKSTNTVNSMKLKSFMLKWLVSYLLSIHKLKCSVFAIF